MSFIKRLKHVKLNPAKLLTPMNKYIQITLHQLFLTD